jgi:hypothetical protein
MHVFFHLNNSLGNKWFSFKISSLSIYTIIPFLACSLTRHLRPIMLEFYHVLAQGQVLGLQFNKFPNLLIIFLKFFPRHFVCDSNYPIPQLHASFNVCARIPLTLWVSTFYVVLMSMNALEPMMQFMTPLLPLGECWFLCRMKIITCISFNHIQLLLLMNWHWPNLSGFTSLILHNSKIYYFRWNSNQRKELS